MTIDEAIKKHCEEAKRQESIANGAEYLGVSRESIEHCRECAADQRQLAEWLMELKEAKRLLRAAMDDMNTLYEAGKDEGCIGIKFKWRYADEVEKLLGGGLNVNQIKC